MTSITWIGEKMISVLFNLIGILGAILIICLLILGLLTVGVMVIAVVVGLIKESGKNGKSKK